MFDEFGESGGGRGEGDDVGQVSGDWAEGESVGACVCVLLVLVGWQSIGVWDLVYACCVHWCFIFIPVNRLHSINIHLLKILSIDCKQSRAWFLLYIHNNHIND